MVVDVVGFFTPDDSHGRFVALDPVRLVDTRPPTVGPLVTFSPGGVQSLAVTGGEVPADASAVVANVTVTDTATGTFMTAYPTSSPAQPPPNASNVNVAAGDTVPNLVTVAVGAGGKVSLFNQLGTANTVIDLAGYYH